MDRTAVLQKIDRGADTNAMELNLSKMELTEIPEAIAALKQLKNFDLRSNRITIVPQLLAQMPKLTKLGLDNNPLSNVPPEIIRRGWGRRRTISGLFYGW